MKIQGDIGSSKMKLRMNFKIITRTASVLQSTIWLLPKPAAFCMD